MLLSVMVGVQGMILRRGAMHHWATVDPNPISHPIMISLILLSPLHLQTVCYPILNPKIHSSLAGMKVWLQKLNFIAIESLKPGKNCWPLIVELYLVSQRGLQPCSWRTPLIGTALRQLCLQHNPEQKLPRRFVRLASSTWPSRVF